MTKILAHLLLCLSLFIDASHDPIGPQFPSYNTVVGIWACIICVSCGKDDPSGETALTNVSTFVSVGLTSLVFDVIFCGMWGPALLREYSNGGGRVTFKAFIVAMVVKAMLLLACATRIVQQNTSAKSREVREADGSLSESRFVDVEAPFEDGLSSRKNATLSPPQPAPFSPGLPGLISPAPTVLSSRIIETP